MDILKVLVIVAAVSGCGTVRPVPVETVRVEREYVDRLRVDSVVVHDSVIIREKGDTVIIKECHTEYRDRVTRDTVIVEKRDTIPVPVIVEKVKYKTPRIMWWIIIILGVMALPTVRNLTKFIK